MEEEGMEGGRRDGGTEGWRDGGMEGWRYAVMEVWRNRVMEEGRDGGWRVCIEEGMKGWSTEYRISVNVLIPSP